MGAGGSIPSKSRRKKDRGVYLQNANFLNASTQPVHFYGTSIPPPPPPQMGYGYNVNQHQPPQPGYGFAPHVMPGAQVEALPYGQHLPVSSPERGNHLQQNKETRADVISSSSEDEEDKEPINIYETSEERDRTYMMVLTADEFLGRMVETDARIHTISQAVEKDLHKKTIADQLGLRGHLQDELLRIEQMLSTDDPRLKNLKLFEQSFPLVVSKLKELRNKRQIVKLDFVQEELPPSQMNAVGEQSTSTSGQGVGGTSSPEGTQTSTASTNSAGVQNNGSTSSDAAVEITEEQLKKTHVEEEQQVAANYAERLVNRNNLTQDEVDKLLQDHALQMQALRTRQDEEKQSLKERMREKLKKKLRNNSQYGHKAETEEEDKDKDKDKDVTVDPFISKVPEETSEEEDSDGENEALRETMWNKMTLSHKMTAENLKDMVASFAKEDEKNRSLKRQSTQSKLPVLHEVPTPRTARNDTSEQPDEIENNVDSASVSSLVTTGTDAHGGNLTARSTTFIDSEDTDAEQIKAMLREDSELIREITKKSRESMRPEEYQEFLEKYFNDRDRLRRLKQQERDKVKAKLKDRLGANKTGDYSDDFESDDEFGDVLTPVLDEEETKELDVVKQQFLEKLNKKRQKKELSEKDVKKLLRKYRKEQIKVIRERNEAKVQHNDKMQAKLAERLQNKKEAEESTPEEGQSSDNGDDDTVFFARIQQMLTNGELTKDQFADMLKSYMDKKKVEKRKKRQPNTPDDGRDKEGAAKLVEIHNKEKQELMDIRRAQKEKLDARLQKRLKSKQNKQLASDAERDNYSSADDKW